MKKSFIFYIIFLSILFFTGESAYSQLSGIKTIPGDYASLTAAITDLNTVGVGSGGVTFNVAAGYTETAGNLVITATGTSSNPITFQKSGAGANPLITANAGVGTMDGIIKLSGTDYITFDGIDVSESVDNITTTTRMEWGYAILKVDGTNGSQYVTIKNCTITLNKLHTSTYGIYSANHTIASTTSLTVTALTGSNSNNKIFGNTIQNCYSGIWMGGYADATPFNYYDHNNELGVNGGNTIRLFGGGAVATYGIYTIYQDSLKVNNNNIGGGTGSTSTQYGIMLSTSTNASILVYNNTVSDTTATLSSSTYGIALSNAGYTGSDNTVIVKRNTVQGMTNTGAGTTAALYGFYIYYTTAINIIVDSNQVINNKWGNTSGTFTGSMYGMYIYPYTTSPVAGSTETISNNYIAGNKRTQSTVGSGTHYQMYIYYGNETVNVYNNIIENDTIPTTATSYGMYIYNYYATTASYYNNTVRNITKTDGSSGLYYSVYLSNAAYTGTCNYYNNSVYNIKNGFAAGTLYGHYIAASSVTKNIYGNTAYNLQTAMGGSVYGIYQSSGTTVNLYRNSVYNLRSSTGAGYGIYVASGTTNNIYNNYISDIRSDSSSNAMAVAGLYLSGGTTNNVYYNTVYINAASHLTGNIFGTAALWASTTPTLDLRNNILVNVSVPGTGGGFTTAYYRSSSSLTTYSSLSNNNDFYTGTPDTNHIIYYDGTNYMRTLSDYKLFMAPRDANSVTENPPFVNVSTKPYDLHLNAAIATQLESNGLQISSITTDADGQARYPNAGYPVNPSFPPTAPDIGSDEIGGIPLDVLGPNIVYTPLNHTNSTSPRTLTATITDAAGVPISGTGLPRLYWRINSSSFTGVSATSLGNNQYSFTFGSGVTTGDTVSYYVCAQDNTTPNPNVSVFPAQGAAGFTSNPPAVSTPPTNPSFYYIAQAGLAGDYTVGIAMFNQITGRNITFQKVVTRVMKEVIIEDKPERTETVKGQEETESATSISSEANGRKELREVEEISWIPMENGVEYKGDLYIKKSENPNFSYPMGTEGVYATLTAAINDLNIRGVSGATRFLLTDASYSTGETFPQIININNDLKPTSSNTVTIKPNTGVVSSITGASNGSQIFKILNNYITIDGSNTLNGTTRDLTIQNTSVTTPQVIHVGSIGTTPITNITVKNCNIINGTNSSSAMVVSDGTTSGTAGYFNNITVQNNSFQLSYIALYNTAVSSAGNGSGLLITGNDFNTNTSQVRLVRIYVQGVDGATVTNNNMGNDSNGTDASNITGVWFATGTINSTIANNVINEMRGYGAPRGIAVSSAVPNANINITGNTISGIRTAYSSATYGIYVFSTTSGISIKKNKISNLRNYATGGYGARGINIATSVTPANIDVINNFVWDVAATSDASATYWGIGIAIDASASTFNVYSNSVNLYDSLFGYTSGTIHSAFYVSSGATIVNVRDNIFVNGFNNINSTTDKSYAIYSAAANTAFTDINYNDYHAYGTTGILGYLGSNKLTLEEWRTATGKDLNSISNDPLYFSDNNLHIDSTQSSPVSNAGEFIAAVTDDIDGQTRLNPPDIGADEGNFSLLTPPPPPSLSSPANNATGQPYASLNLVWFKSINAVTYRIQLSTNSGFTNFIINDSTVTDSIKTVTGLNPLTQYWWRVSAKNAAGTSNFSTVFTFTTMPLPPAIVNLKVVPGGFYNTSTGTLNMRDTLRVILVDSASGLKVDSNKVVLDSLTFSAPLSFFNVETGSYYIYIYHRNHIPIASRLEQNIVRGSTVNYDFTTDSAKTYGYNVIKVSTSPVVWALIPGDANSDEFVDGLDQTIWLQQNGSDGYFSGDFNGDRFVDGLDQTIWIIYNGNGSFLPVIFNEDIKDIEKLLQYKREYKEVIDNRKTSIKNNKK